MNLCYLGLGSNLQTPERQIRKALKAIKAIPNTAIIKVAPLYPNKAMGLKMQPDYSNTVVAIKTFLTPIELLNFCQQIEKKQGRVRKIRWGARTLDIDILYFGTKKLKSPRLQLPHPGVTDRDFVQIPLKKLTK